MTTPSSRRLPRNFFDTAAPFKIEGVYCKLIPLTKGQFAIVDEADYPVISKYTWGAKWDKGISGFYAFRTGRSDDGSKMILMHREIMGFDVGDPRFVDHVHPSGSLDNRRRNLREATRSQNQHNQRISKRNTTGFKGVHFDPVNNKYRAMITVNYKVHYGGRHSTPEAAFRARCVLAEKFHGEFANDGTIQRS